MMSSFEQVRFYIYGYFDRVEVLLISCTQALKTHAGIENESAANDERKS